jgi:hypothetical protein
MAIGRLAVLPHLKAAIPVQTMHRDELVVVAKVGKPQIRENTDASTRDF